MKNLSKVIVKARKELKEDILLRYDNSEYWNIDVLNDILHRLSEEEKETFLRIIGI